MNVVMSQCNRCDAAMIKTKSDICAKCFSGNIKPGLPKHK